MILFRLGEKCLDLIRWSAVKKLICSGFEDKEDINTDNYFDHMIQDPNKNVNKNKKLLENFLD